LIIPAAISVSWGMGPGSAASYAVLAVGLIVALTGAIAAHRRRRSDAYGSAVWDDGRCLARRDGLIVGRAPVGRRLLRYAGEGHVLTVAPTRSGKGVSAVIPNLLLYAGSIVVTDPKGENYAVTAARRRALGQRIVAYDPFGVIVPREDRAAYNPLDRVETIDDARLLADMIVIPDGRTEAFWEEEARAILVGLILHASMGPTPSLPLVRAYLTLPPKEFRALLAHMVASASPLVRRAAAQIAQKSPRERAAVLSTAQSHTHFLDSQAMVDVLGETRRPLGPAGAETTTYLILPPERIDGYRRWLRLMIGSMVSAITRRRRARRIVFLLDEFAHLGRMRPVEQGISLVGAYGVGFWLLIQDLAQLRATYGESWPTFLANAEVLQAFGINDWETAEHLSRLAGETTVRVDESHERARRLITADEVRRLAPDLQLLFVRGHAPIAARRVSYLRDDEFHGYGGSNPLHAVALA
jgi:type IV secretion system protein VirD4